MPETGKVKRKEITITEEVPDDLSI